MHVEEMGILDVLGQDDVRYVIPEYQRRYSWKERQCRELWLDACRAARSGTRHFTGAVLCKNAGVDKEGRRRMQVVDGQQRLTSIYLILRALADHLACEEGSASSEPIPQADVKKLLCAAFVPDENNERFDANLSLFRSLMDDESFDFWQLWHGLSHLVTIIIEIDDDEDPQPIFESLNSKGARLNVADMIRNYLLSAQTHDEQERLYDEYWIPIEGSFYPDPGSLRLDNMIKAWLAIRVKRVRARTPDDVYSAFKCYMEDDWTGTMEPVLAELRSFAVVWAENYRYHAVKKFKSASWAINGAPTLTSAYPLKPADNPEYARRVREQLANVDADL